MAPQAITNHAIIQSAATACIAMGFYAIYHNKVRGTVCSMAGRGVGERLARRGTLPRCPHLLALTPTLPQNLKGKQHFTSLHGKVGLCTFCLALAAPLLGAASFRRLGIIQRFPEPWQPRLKWLHRLVRLGGQVAARGWSGVDAAGGRSAVACRAG